MIGLFTFAGCQHGGVGMAESPAWFATATTEQQIAYFSKRCAAYGFQPNTNEMAQCLMSESQSSRRGARMQAALASKSIGNSARRNTSTTINCNTYGNNTRCSSY